MILNKMKVVSVSFLVALFLPLAMAADGGDKYVTAYLDTLGGKQKSSIPYKFMEGLVSKSQNNFDFTQIKYSDYVELRAFEAWLSRELKRPVSVTTVLFTQLEVGALKNRKSLAEFLVRMAPCFEGYDNVQYGKVLGVLAEKDLGLIINATISNHNRLKKLISSKKEAPDACDESLRLQASKAKSEKAFHAWAVMDLLVTIWTGPQDLPKDLKSKYGKLRKSYLDNDEALGPYIKYLDAQLL